MNYKKIKNKNIKKKLFFNFILITFILNLITIAQQESIEYNSNELNSQFQNTFEDYVEIISASDIENYLIYIEDLTIFNINEKKLIINNTNIANNPFKIKFVFLKSEQNNPKIIFYIEKEQELFSIEQINKGETYIYLGLPENLNIYEKEKKSIVYFVEHFEPDLKITDQKRNLENKFFSFNTINNPSVKINSSDLVLKNDLMNNKFLIHKDSFNKTENFKDREINILQKNKLFQIFNYFNLLVFRFTDEFQFSNEYDRGFFLKTNKEQDNLKLDYYNELSDNYVDVTIENCNKFTSLTNYDTFINEIFYIKFYNSLKNKEKNANIKNKNILIEIKQNSKKQDYLYEYYNALDYISEYIKSNISNENKIFVKININSTILSNDFKEFLEIASYLNEKLKFYGYNLYFIYSEKINTNKELLIKPDAYLDLINHSKNFYLKIILPDLEQGKYLEKLENNEKIRLNSKDYYVYLFENNALENINYIAFSINNTNEKGLNFCKNITNIGFYKNSEYCLDSSYSYRMLLDLAKDYDKKELKSIIFLDEIEINQNNFDIYNYIENLKADPYVEAVFLKGDVCNE